MLNNEPGLFCFANEEQQSSSASLPRTIEPLFQFGKAKLDKFPCPNPNSPLSPICTEARRLEEERKARLLFRNGIPLKMCSNCGTTSTPSWRRCVEGKNLLCNACGLYAKLHNKSRPFVISIDGSVKVQRQGANEATVCVNCSTTETPLWRRGQNGESLCNACGLYLKQHNRNREVKRFTEVSLMEMQKERSLMPSASSSMGNLGTIDISALESLANELYAPANTGGIFGCRGDDKELLEKLQYLEDAAAFLLSSCENGVDSREKNCK
jgi:hypothetical protein